MAFDAVQQLLKEKGEDLVAALERSLPRSSDASGHLRESIHFTINRFGLLYKFELSLADYYEWVDKGRAPGKMPPLENIIRWIGTKGLATSKKNRPSKLKKISEELNKTTRTAYAIASAIAKHGTKGTNFYSSVVPEWVENLKKELPKALKRDVLVELKAL